MMRRSMAGSPGPLPATGFMRVSMVLVLVGIAWAAAAAAADYELRLVPYDAPNTFVSDRAQKDQDYSWGVIFHSLSKGERPRFPIPYLCWALNVKLDDQPVFELYEKDHFIARLPKARPELKPGKHTIWPGDHVFTVEKDGSLSTDDPELVISQEEIDGRPFHILRIKCYPFSVKATNIDPRAAKPKHINEEMPLPNLTVRDAKDSAAGEARKAEAARRQAENPDAPPLEFKGATEIIPGITNRFRTLTAWLPAHTSGEGYALFPLGQRFYLGADGLKLLGADDERMPGWEVNGYQIVIPAVPIPVSGEINTEIVVTGVQKLEFREKKLADSAMLYARRSPYEFRVSRAGASLMIDPDLSKLPNKVLRVEIDPSYVPYQRGLVVETDTRHLNIGQKVRARIRAVAPAVGDRSAGDYEIATRAARAAAKQVEQHQKTLETRTTDLEKLLKTQVDAKAQKDAAKDEKAQKDAEAALTKANQGVEGGRNALKTTRDALVKALAHKKEADEEVVAAKARADATVSSNALADATPFVRLRAASTKEWIDITTTNGTDATIEFTVPELVDGVYEIRLGVTPAQQGHRNFYIDQWTTIAAGASNGIGVFTQRGRTVFFRGEDFWLAVALTATARPIAVGTPVTVELVDSAGARIPFYHAEIQQRIPERETFILSVSADTSQGLAPGKYAVEAKLGDRKGPPFDLEMVDPAPETHFTKLLLGKYNAFGSLYGSCLSSKDVSPDNIARAIADTYNAFKGMSYGIDRVVFPDLGLVNLVRERPELGPWEAYAPPSGRDQFLNALARYNVRFYENLFTQHDSMMPRGDMIMAACERYTALETQSMRHSPVFRGVCLYDELSQSLDHDTGMDMMAYFHRADEMNYRRKHNGRTSSEALKARDRYFSRPPGRRDLEDLEIYKTWPKHLDDQWEEFSRRMSDVARAVMPEAVNFTLARIHALPGGNVNRQWEGIFRPLDVAVTVGYKDMGGWGAFPCAGPICADSLRTRDGLQVWPTIYGAGSGRFGSSNVRQAFFTLSQKCEGLSFMQFHSTPDAPLATSYWQHSHFDALTDISTVCTRYGDLLLAAERGYKKVAIYYSREMSYVFGGVLPCEELWTACMRAGYPADFITDDQLLAGKAMEYDVTFAPGIGQMDCIPPKILNALRNIADAKDKILAVEIQSQLKLDGMVRINSYLNEIDGGATFPKHLDHDDERWWDKTGQTTQAIHELMKEHKIAPAAKHSLLVGPDWLKCRDGQYMVMPNLARTDFTGDHKTTYQAPSQPTLEIPAERFPAGHQRVCYDMLEMKRLETTTKTGEDNKQWITVRPDMRHYPGKMLAFMPAEIESVVIRAMPSVRAGATLSFEIYAADKQGKMIDAGIPLEITIAAPAAPPAPGKELQKTWRAAAPTYRGSYGVPVNIPANSLTMHVRELISGRVAEATISVEAGELVPVTLDTTPARMPEPKRVPEFMQKAAAVAKPLFTPDDLLYPGRLALRIRDGEDKLSWDLKAGLAPETLKLFEAHKPDKEPSDELVEALVKELNKVVATGRLYTDARFPIGSLTVETGRIGPLVTDESKWPDLNRQLLEEYEFYKQDIIQRYPVYIGVEEEWARPQAERVAKALIGKGLRVRVTHMEPWQRPAGAIKPTGESAGDLILDGTRLWRGEVVIPGVFVGGPLILLGSRKGMVTALVGRDLLPEPLSENFPGPGKAVVAWIHQAFSNDNDTLAVLANDPAGLERAVDALLGVTQQPTPTRSMHPVVEQPRFDDKAVLVEASGNKLEPLSYQDAYRDEDRVVTMDVDPATGRTLVGTFGYGHNLFCFSHEGKLLWKNFLPEHDVYLLKWYDGGKKVLASTAHGFYIFLINGQDGKIVKKFASTEWPDFHSDREFNTQVHIVLNPPIRQLLITGRTGLLAVTYEGKKMWFHDRARRIVDYPPEAVQTSWASFGNYLQLAAGVPSPDGTRVGYNEYRLFGSYMAMAGPLPLWKNEPEILDAKTGKVLLKNFRDEGSNDLWRITWPSGGDDRDNDGLPDPWIHARNLRAPLLFDATHKPNGDQPNRGKLGKFDPPLNPVLKTGGRVQAEVYYAEGFDIKGRSTWVVADKNFWVKSLDVRSADDTRLYRCSRDGLVRCIDLRSGKVIWNYKLKCAARMRNAADNNVIAGARDGTIARFDADGKIVWKTRLREHHEMPSDNYGAYLTAAKRRDIDSTRDVYPVYNDTPNDYNNGTPNDLKDDILRMGIQQLDNGGFETPNEKFDEDERWRTNTGQVQFDTLAHDGKKSLRLAPGQLVTCTVQRKVIPSATYLFEFFYRTDSFDTQLAVGAVLSGPPGGANGSANAPLTVSNFSARPGEWTFGRLALKSWADTGSIVIGFEAGGGQAHVDFVSLRPVRFPSANLLANAELHKVEVTHPKDYRDQYPRIPPPLKQKLLTANNVTSFLQATPLGALIFTQEQAFLYNGKIDDVGRMWCYRPERMGFSVGLTQPAWVSHLVLYMNNGTPDSVYRNITILANNLDVNPPVPFTAALVRGNERRFVVVSLDPPIYTDNLKVLPGKYRAQRDSITEVEVYGPVGGPEMMKEKKPYSDQLATSMFMGSKSHVPVALPDDLVGAYKARGLPGGSGEVSAAFHAEATAVNGSITYADSSGWIPDVPLTKERVAARSPGWKIGTACPLTTPARYAGRLIVGSADYKMHAVADNGVHIWAFGTGGRIYSSPIPDRDEVYFGSDDGQLYKIDIDSGILIWEFKTGDRIRSSPALDDQKVYVASWDGFVYAVDIVRGTQVWKAPIARYSSSSPAVHGGCVYIGDEEGNLHCLNAGNGASIWKTSIGDMISMCPIVTPEGLFVTANDGTAALVAMNGAVTWKGDVLKPMRKPGEVPPRFTGQPFATKTQVVVPGTKGLLVLKRADGTPDTRFTPPVTGRNYVSAVRYGSALCLIENRNQWQQGGPESYIVYHGGGALVWEPK